MNNIWVILLFLTITTINVQAGNQLQYCKNALSTQASMSTANAYSYCMKDSSEEFINCTIDLFDNESITGIRAAETCLKNKSIEFRRDCVKPFQDPYGISGVVAIDICLRSPSMSMKLKRCIVDFSNRLPPSFAYSHCTKELGIK